MKNPDITQHIADMKVCCKKILQHTQSLKPTDLENNELLALAVERLFEILGEAANRIPKEFQTTCPRLPWAKVIGMRNIISHGYDKLNYAILLSTAQEDLPLLAIELDKIKI